MPEILPDHVPSPRTGLFWDGTAYRPGTIDAAGHIQIDVLSTVMDVTAATAANQLLALAQLQLIADLRVCLQTVATNRFIVRGEDQLFSFLGVLAYSRSSVISGAGGYADSSPCPPGEIWIVTDVFAYDRTSPTTRHDYQLFHNTIGYPFATRVAAFAAFDGSEYSGWKWLDPADVIRVYFIGAPALDDIDIHITGYRMTLEV